MVTLAGCWTWVCVCARVKIPDFELLIPSVSPHTHERTHVFFVIDLLDHRTVLLLDCAFHHDEMQMKRIQCMARDLVVFGFSTEVLPPVSTPLLEAGQYQAVHFTFAVEQLDWYLEKIEFWFEDRDEVILVGSGVSVQGEGFIVMEWEECEIDPLFLKILAGEELVNDVCVYTRSEEVE